VKTGRATTPRTRTRGAGFTTDHPAPRPLEPSASPGDDPAALMDQDTAYRHHQAGRFADAGRIYQHLLDQNPDDVGVLHLFGVMHQQCGFPARAAELIGRAIALRPDVAAFHANLAEARRSLKQYAAAADACRAALRLQPDYPEALHNLGLALHDQGLDAEAVAQFDAALALRPEFADAHNSRGTSLQTLGNAAEAADAFRAAVRLDPALAVAHANLGQVLTDTGRPAEGLGHCREAVRLRPDFPAAHNNLGNALRALKSWTAAADVYGEAIRLDPGLGVAHANLGLALQSGGDLLAALPHLRRAVDLAPDDADLRRHLAYAYGSDEDWPAAIPHCEYRARLDPENADAHCDLGWAYLSGEWPDRAEAALRRAIALRPDHLDAWLNLGLLHEQRGALAEAEDCYRQAEVWHPRSPLPLARRAAVARGRIADADRDRLRFHLYEPLAPPLRTSALYALAQVADARGDHAEAAACAAPANALARQARHSLGQHYDPDAHARFVDRIVASFTPDLFARLGAGGEEDPRGDEGPQPVFVFGMPRSGTTLVEQVLASHSRVYGAGELPLARRALDALSSDASSPDSPSPDSAPPDAHGAGRLGAAVAALDAADLRRLAAAYRAGVADLFARQGGRAAGEVPARTVDKMPDNYVCLGLIALMFPRATLIHVRRDLRDVAVSCWLTQFRSIRWAETPDDLARRCQDYLRLMDHWRAVLPRTIHEVSYERLVDDFEPDARRLVAACGLDWEPACLDFHRTSRAVRTASIAQVRQPLYRNSLARWKAYEPYLADLFGRLPGVGA
jgi:tetratricopeptide (TPR) repeat protein